MIETSLYRLSSPVGKVGLSAHWWQGCLGGVWHGFANAASWGNR